MTEIKPSTGVENRNSVYADPETLILLRRIASAKPKMVKKIIKVMA